MSQRLKYLGLSNCLHMANGDVELIVSTDVGPRILRYGFPGKSNLFGEFPELVTHSPVGDWKPYGGHRLWAAPENMSTSYAPDNVPIQFQSEGDRTLRLTAPMDAAGLRKQITIRLAERGTSVEVEHAITNCNGWTIQIAPWSITIHRGGTIILPREPFRSHDDCVVPAQPLTLWYFTDLQDPRLALGSRYFIVRGDDARSSPQKIGICNKQGWCGYHNGDTLLIKSFRFDPNATYPDLGSNNEAYVAGPYMETEFLGPLSLLAQDETVVLSERWQLLQDIHLPDDARAREDAIENVIASHRASVIMR